VGEGRGKRDGGVKQLIMSNIVDTILDSFSLKRNDSIYMPFSYAVVGVRIEPSSFPELRRVSFSSGSQGVEEPNPDPEVSEISVLILRHGRF
jgi:hypothetical protein